MRILTAGDHELVRTALSRSRGLLLRERIRQFKGEMSRESMPIARWRNPIAENGSSQDLRILIADDSELVRSAIAALISRGACGEVCAEAANGEQALEKARELRPSVILLDINMPDISGLEVARRLRGEMPAVVIFIMSQNDASMLLPGAMAAGANGCLDKSNLASDLAQCLKAIGESQRSDIQGAA